MYIYRQSYLKIHAKRLINILFIYIRCSSAHFLIKNRDFISHSGDISKLLASTLGLLNIPFIQNTLFLYIINIYKTVLGLLLL